MKKSHKLITSYEFLNTAPCAETPRLERLEVDLEIAQTELLRIGADSIELVEEIKKLRSETTELRADTKIMRAEMTMMKDHQREAFNANKALEKETRFLVDRVRILEKENRFLKEKDAERVAEIAQLRTEKASWTASSSKHKALPERMEEEESLMARIEKDKGIIHKLLHQANNGASITHSALVSLTDKVVCLGHNKERPN